MARHFIGIDLAWSPANPTAVSVVREETDTLFLEKSLYAADLDEILSLIEKYPNAIVGVDGPLIITNDSGHRPNELAFMKAFGHYRLGVHTANRTLFSKRFPKYTGFALYQGLQKAGFDFSYHNLYELYPYAIILKCFNNDKILRYKSGVPMDKRTANPRLLRDKIEKHIKIRETLLPDPGTLKGKTRKALEDLLDALVCSYGLWYCTSHEYRTFGDFQSGLLLTPVP